MSGWRRGQARAQQAAQREGVILTSELVEGDEVQAIVEWVQRTQSDLLVLGLHRHSSLLATCGITPPMIFHSS